MEQDPEYLRNRSRSLHASYRRNRRLLKVFVAVAIVIFAVRFVAAAIDRLAGLGWGFARADVWESLGAIAVAGLFWLIAMTVQAILLAYVRHTYGPDPAE